MQTGKHCTLFDLTKPIRGITSYRNGSSDLIVIACADDGRLYKWNGTTNTQTALPWPSSTISCQGDGLLYIPSRSSVDCIDIITRRRTQTTAAATRLEVSSFQTFTVTSRVRNSLLFIYSQNDLHGIAEYVNP